MLLDDDHPRTVFMNNDNTPTICECCGQVIRKPNSVTITKRMIRLLDQIGQMNMNGIPWVKIQQDGNLIPEDEREMTIQCDAMLATRLKWFGLTKLQQPYSGIHTVTDLGFKFLCNEAEVPVVIYCKGGAVLSQSEERQKISDCAGAEYDREFWNGLSLQTV